MCHRHKGACVGGGCGRCPTGQLKIPIVIRAVRGPRSWPPGILPPARAVLMGTCWPAWEVPRPSGPAHLNQRTCRLVVSSDWLPSLTHLHCRHLLAAEPPAVPEGTGARPHTPGACDPITQTAEDLHVAVAWEPTGIHTADRAPSPPGALPSLG